MKAILKNSVLAGTATILDRGSMVVLTALLSHALAPEAFEQFGRFQLTLTTLAAFSGLGVAVSAARLFAEYQTRRSSDLSIVGTMWLLSLIAAGILGVAGIVLASMAGAPSPSNAIPDWLLVIGVLVLACGIVANGGVLGLSLFRQSVTIAVVAATAAVAGGWIAAQNQSAIVAAWALIFSYGATTLFSALVVLRKVGWKTIFVSPLLARRRLGAVADLIGPLAGVTLLAALGNWLTGHILLRMGSSSLAFSGFIIGLQWYGLAQFLPGILTRAVFPLLTRDENAESRKILIVSLAAALAISLATALAVAVASPFIATFYEERVVKGGAVIVAFAFAAFPQSIANLLGNVIIIKGKQRAWLFLSIGWFVVQVSSAAAFARWNAFGAAASLFLSGIALTLCAGWYAYAKRLA